MKWISVSSAIMDAMVMPLQEKMEDWKKVIVQLEKDRNRGRWNFCTKLSVNGKDYTRFHITHTLTITFIGAYYIGSITDWSAFATCDLRLLNFAC